jgi:hypothetical protein
MIAYDKTDVKVRGEALSEVWWQGRQWAVTAYGLECRDGTYVLDTKQLVDNAAVHSCIEHVGEKTWCDVDDFATAYYVAVAMHGLRLTKAMRAVAAKGHSRAVVSHEKGKLYRELFPETRRFELVNLSELRRRSGAVDEEYYRRKAQV